MIKNIQELNSVIIEKIAPLESIEERYLNEEGLAAREAYRAVLWHVGFHESLQELSEDGQFQDIVSIPDKNPEYYKILRMINRVIERACKE